MSRAFDNAAETDRVRKNQDRNAPHYDRQIAFFERILFGDGRPWVCEQARGQVLELAVGTARNLPFYPDDVTVTGIELSAEMLAIGRGRAQQLGRQADLRLGDAQALDFPDNSFDTVVCTLGLCTIPDPRRAVAEARRVLRPGGRILLLEHVRSPSPPIRVIQRLLDPLTVRFAADHLTREPLDYVESEGFEIERVERWKWGIVERLTARKPGEQAASVEAPDQARHSVHELRLSPARSASWRSDGIRRGWRVRQWSDVVRFLGCRHASCRRRPCHRLPL